MNSLLSPPPQARCEGCNQIFPSKNAAKRHAATAGHAAAGVVFCCDQCSTVLRTLESYDEHKLHHNSYNASTCPTCKIRFATRGELAQHVMNGYYCVLCNMCLSPGENLAHHWWASSKHPRCEECKIAFRDAAGLSQHEPVCPSSLSARKAVEHIVPLWRCRSCLRKNCNNPVTTICGHLFCEECLMREIRTKLRCPVCNYVFLTRFPLDP